MTTQRTAEQIVDLVAGHAFVTGTEDALQTALADVLAEAGLTPHREARLSAQDRVDLLIGDVAVEVKVAGSLVTVLRQCQRYARSPQVAAVVLATTVPEHRQAPSTIGGKPLLVAPVAGGWLT